MTASPRICASAHTVGPKVALRLDDDAQVLVLAVGVGVEDAIAEGLNRGLAGIFVLAGRNPDDVRKLARESHEANAVRHAGRFIVAPLQDRHARLDAGILKPRLGRALHHRQDAEMSQHPALEGKTILNVHPG